MTAAQAIELCLQQYEAYTAPDLRSTPSGEPRAYERHVDPHWFVLIPASNQYGPGYIHCVLGGPYSDPTLHGVGESTESAITDEYIEWVINNNGGL